MKTVPSDDTPVRLLTVKEYADLKRVHVETVRVWCRAGKVPAERTTPGCGHWRIRVEEKRP